METFPERQPMGMISQSDLPAKIAELLEETTRVITELEKLIPHTSIPSIQSGLVKKLTEAKANQLALQGGFIPVEGGWWGKTDSKNKWTKRDVKAVMDTMPEDIKESWERVKEMGVFQNFSVSIGGGDPVLVGNVGKKHYFIGAWVNFVGGYSAGFCIKPKVEVLEID